MTHKINDSDGEEFEVQDSGRHDGVSSAPGMFNRGLIRTQTN